MRNQPDLIVPVRDRRQHRRILTLKNFAYVAVAFIILFAGLTVESNVRHTEKTDDYGRLLAKQVHTDVALEQKRAAGVAAPIQDETSADPTLVSAQNRAQWLGVEPATTSTVFPTTTAEAPGIVVTRQNPQPSQPLLSGGIFRQ